MAMSRVRFNAASLIFAGAACAALPNAVGAPDDVQCPAQLPAGAVQLVGSPTGWIAYAPAPLRLHSVGFMDGPPADMAERVPTTVDQHKHRSTVTWRFDDGPLVRGRWLTCGYGDGGAITLSRQVPENTASCTAYYRNGTLPNFKDIRVECR